MTSHDGALDRLLIRETIDRYGHCFDEGDFEAFAGLFAEEAVWDCEPDPDLFEADLPLRGRDAILKAFRERYDAVRPHGRRRHVMTNSVIRSLEGDRATAVTYLLALGIPHGETPEVLGTGAYEDTLERRDDRWVFASRHLRLDALDAQYVD